MSDEQPGDVRDTLSGLERRLREMEGDLRSGAAKPEAATGGPGGAKRDDRERRRPSGLLIGGLGAAALLIIVLIAVLSSSGSGTKSSGSGPSQIALGAGLSGSDAALGVAKLSGVRAASGDAAAEACAGTAGAALVIVQPAPKSVGCAGLQELATMTVSATAVAQRGGARGCLRSGQVAAQLRRPPGRLTRKRAVAVLKARRASAANTAASNASKAASLQAERRAAANAGNVFDAANNLSLVKVRNAAGKCIAPTAATLRSGTYPLSVRISLLARPDSATSPTVSAVDSTLRKALSGAVPVEAAVRGG